MGEDAREFIQGASDHLVFDVAWLDGFIDFAGKDMQHFFDSVQALVADGGYVALHSTLTNRLTRVWLDSCSPMHRVSFMEPCKRFQNSTTIFQKRPDGWSEPMFSDLP